MLGIGISKRNLVRFFSMRTNSINMEFVGSEVVAYASAAEAAGIYT